MKKATGFTLMELLIAIVIVGILAAIAIPGYNNQIRKTRRADARVALTQAAAMQERFYMRNNAYTQQLTDLGSSSASSFLSPSGYYAITVTNTGCPNSQPNGSCFTLTASATGAQTSDTQCATFTLTDAGVKTAANSAGAANTNCW